MAELTSTLLHGSDLHKLAELTSEQALQVFSGAPVKNLILQPGMTFLDVSRAAGCFLTDSRFQKKELQE